MRSYERVEITEKELEDAGRQAPTLIEEGLRLATTKGRRNVAPLMCFWWTVTEPWY